MAFKNFTKVLSIAGFAAAASIPQLATAQMGGGAGSCGPSVQSEYCEDLCDAIILVEDLYSRSTSADLDEARDALETEFSYSCAE